MLLHVSGAHLRFSSDGLRATLAGSPGPGVAAETGSNAAAALHSAAKVVETTYDAPFLAHGWCRPRRWHASTPMAPSTSGCRTRRPTRSWRRLPRSQVNSAVAVGLSSSLLEEVVYENGVPRARNFDGYPILPPGRMPRVHVRIIESGASTPLPP